MTTSTPSMSQIIREAYANRGITITELAESRIRRHIFRNAHIVDNFATSRVSQVALPLLSAHLFRDISTTELSAVEKDLSSELGITVRIALCRCSGLPFFKTTLIQTPRRKLNDDNS